jgi:hypothetical protein
MKRGQRSRTKVPGSWAIRVDISNTSFELIEYLYYEFRGRLDFRIRVLNTEYRDCYKFEVERHESLVTFLTGLLPYLIIKKRQAEVALEWAQRHLANNNAKQGKLHGKYTAKRIFDPAVEEGVHKLLVELNNPPIVSSEGPSNIASRSGCHSRTQPSLARDPNPCYPTWAVNARREVLG